MNRWEALGRVFAPGTDGAPRIMGIVNVTPDSFSDGGCWGSPEAAAEHARRMVGEGAALIDVGGESSRPGSQPIGVEEESRRVIPAVEAIADRAGAPISIDTTKPEVARRAIRAGASIVNDIQGLAGDPEMIRLAAETGCGVVIMHMAGTPRTMQAAPRYGDVVTEVADWLARRVDAAEAAGIGRERIAVDPGIGFGKTFGHNVELLRNLGRFGSLGCAVLVGTSRKGFLGTITGRPVEGRLTASVASSLAAGCGGANVLRVHDVGAMADAIKVWAALRGWE